MPRDVKPKEIFEKGYYTDRNLYNLHMTFLYIIEKKPFFNLISKFFVYVIMQKTLG
jgi:hypothetical protein